MSALATSFSQRNLTQLRSEIPLTNDQIIRVAPSIFAPEPHESRSLKYSYIPTISILDGLRKENFLPFMVAQSKSRVPGKSEFTKHMIRLRQAGTVNAAEAFEIILINSHDGTSSYQMLAGLFRFVCCNGMVTGDIMEDLRVAHRGNIQDNVIEAAYRIVENNDVVKNSMEAFKSTPLLLPESVAFAEAALALKYDDVDDSGIVKAPPVSPHQLLQPRRREDANQSNLWNTFNKVQENILKGGLTGRTTTGRRHTTREVQSIDTNVKLNKALWILSEKMAELKGTKVAV